MDYIDYTSRSTQELLAILKGKETDFESSEISKERAKELLSEIEDIEQILRDRDEN